MQYSAEEFAIKVSELILRFNSNGVYFSELISELETIVENLKEEHNDDADDLEEEDED